MKNATRLMWMGALALMLVPSLTLAAIPEGKIAVVRVTSVDGLAQVEGPLEVTQSHAYSFDGTTYRIDSAAVGSLDGVQALLLIDHREDSAMGGKVTRAHSQEVRALNDTQFTVTDIPGKTLSYQLASVAGNLRLLGSGDQILVPGGDNGPYHVWRVDGVSLVSRDAVVLR